MKIHFLGTCAGTEPMPNRKHMSFVIESDGRLYWFDAGEGCSYTAHNMGLDLLRVKSIVISHTHMDHVGGLANLLWNVRKLRNVNKTKPLFGSIDLYIPNMDTWNAIYNLLLHTEGGYKVDFDLNAHKVSEGEVFSDSVMKITALKNTHLPPSNTDAVDSYSYKIECEGKSIVYSGDVGKYSDMDAFFDEERDAVIIETGHFGIDDVYGYLKDKRIERIFFSHNGREILDFPKRSRQKVASLFGDKAVICEDGMTVEL